MSGPGTTLAEKPDAHAFDGRTLEGLLQPTTGTLACRRLQSLACTWNGLTGEITPSIAQCRSLTLLALGNNTLTGEIPACLGTLTQLRMLWLHQNKLSGPIPEALGEMHSIEVLCLHDNQLSGTVPAFDFATLKMCSFSHSMGIEQEQRIAARLPTLRVKAVDDREAAIDNNFTCPLPAGAASVCHAKCAHVSRPLPRV